MWRLPSCWTWKQFSLLSPYSTLEYVLVGIILAMEIEWSLLLRLLTFQAARIRLPLKLCLFYPSPSPNPFFGHFIWSSSAPCCCFSFCEQQQSKTEQIPVRFIVAHRSLDISSEADPSSYTFGLLLLDIVELLQEIALHQGAILFPTVRPRKVT